MCRKVVSVGTGVVIGFIPLDGKQFPQPQLGSPNNLAGEHPMCCRQGHVEGSQEVLPGDSVQTVWPQNFLGLMVKSQIFPSNQ